MTSQIIVALISVFVVSPIIGWTIGYYGSKWWL